jgi:hypothetical protein
MEKGKWKMGMMMNGKWKIENGKGYDNNGNKNDDYSQTI